MATSRKQTKETHNSPRKTPAWSDFEAAQQHVFDEAGIDPESYFVTLENPHGRIHVLELGDPNEEPPVVFLDGSGGCGAFFAPLMTHLPDRRLVAIDRPGWGLSDDFVYTPENHR